jgi:hypothetical protein
MENTYILFINLPEDTQMINSTKNCTISLFNILRVVGGDLFHDAIRVEEWTNEQLSFQISLTALLSRFF